MCTIRLRLTHELRCAIEIANQSIADGTIAELPDSDPPSQVTFSELAAGGMWDDVVVHRFRCTSCGELFSLHAETWYGSGGYWEPENRASIRENL